MIEKTNKSQRKINAWCEKCNDWVDNLMVLDNSNLHSFDIIVRCHGISSGVTVTRELIENSQIYGFILRKNRILSVVCVKSSLFKVPIKPENWRIANEVFQAKKRVFERCYTENDWPYLTVSEQKRDPTKEKRRKITLEG